MWGAERIRGALLKRGIQVGKRTIQRHMRAARPPRPGRGGQSWATFVRNHAHETWACDFLPVVDLGFRSLFAFFIVELDSRRVVHVGAPRHPTDAWVAQQLREATPFGIAPRYLIRDNDRKYGSAFDRVAAGSRMTVLRTPIRAPRANAICERFLGSVRRECLDHILILGAGQLRRVLREYVAYANTARPHQGIGQAIPSARAPAPTAHPTAPIVAIPVLGGLHHDYRRTACVPLPRLNRRMTTRASTGAAGAPPISSGSDVVGAATMAPDGAKVSSLRARALRTTASRCAPWYVQRAAHARHQRAERSTLA